MSDRPKSRTRNKKHKGTPAVLKKRRHSTSALTKSKTTPVFKTPSISEYPTTSKKEDLWTAAVQKTKAQSALLSGRSVPRCPVCRNEDGGEVVFYGMFVWDSNDCKEAYDRHNESFVYRIESGREILLADEVAYVCSTRHAMFQHGNHVQGRGYCGNQWIASLPVARCNVCRFKNEMLLEKRNKIIGYYCIVCKRFSASPTYVDNITEKL